MPNNKATAYAALDTPAVLHRLFHPRSGPGARKQSTSRKDLMIPVADSDIHIGASFHFASTDAPTLLFFHGNGEIVSDYDEVGTIYNTLGINFLVVDYRGYGNSSGKPTVTAMMKDARTIYCFAVDYLQKNRLNPSVSVMGRSLGSASALEIASTEKPSIQSVIIESGFAYVSPLLRKLGINIDQTDFREKEGFRNIDKIGAVESPCLLIHAEFDHIIPIHESRELFENCKADHKELIEISGANHNDIFLKGMDYYLASVKKFVGPKG